MENTNSLLSLSGKLLLNVKLNKSTDEEESKLKLISTEQFLKQLNNDDSKKTFWINIYNAYFQILSNREKMDRKVVFSKRIICIAQNSFSLDDIEHGILRRYRWKWSLGYLQNPFVSNKIKKLAVNKIDYRIHFALNCGVKSCPPIAFYVVDKIDPQLNEAMSAYLISETAIDMVNKEIKTSKLLVWYQGDFGGKLAIKSILQNILEINLEKYKLSFTEYDYNTKLKKFTID